MGSLIGETETRTFDVVNVSVKYPGSKSDREEIDAPAGLAIVSYKAIERYNYGRAGYDFSLVGDNSIFIDDRIVDSKFRGVFDYIENNVDQDKKQEYKKRSNFATRPFVRQERLRPPTASLSSIGIAFTTVMISTAREALWDSQSKSSLCSA